MFNGHTPNFFAAPGRQVNAREIVDVWSVMIDPDGVVVRKTFKLDDGRMFGADEGMLARFQDCGKGDYVVTQPDGYVYLNPRKVFLEKHCNLPSILLRTARACHEANRAYCQAIGDDSQPAWEDTPSWQIHSAMAGVEAIVNDPSTTAEQSHEGWMAQKVADGWTWGPVKNPELKTHPCMVPYSQLPEAQRAKDHIFGAVARAMLREFGVLRGDNDGFSTADDGSRDQEDSEDAQGARGGAAAEDQPAHHGDGRPGGGAEASDGAGAAQAPESSSNALD